MKLFNKIYDLMLSWAQTLYEYRKNQKNKYY